MRLKIEINVTSEEVTDENGNPITGGVITSEVVSDDLKFSAESLCREMEKDEILKEIVFHAAAEFVRLHS